MTGETCNDNRFELIAKYKQKLIEATNIETSEEEMAVIDNILFRFWQMDWLDLLELKEKNRIIELPVPIGSVVWGISIDGSMVMQMLFKSSQIELVIKWWNKTIFATKEEAEAKLQELRAEEEVIKND